MKEKCEKWCTGTIPNECKILYDSSSSLFPSVQLESLGLQSVQRREKETVWRPDRPSALGRSWSFWWWWWWWAFQFAHSFRKLITTKKISSSLSRLCKTTFFAFSSYNWNLVPNDAISGAGERRRDGLLLLLPFIELCVLVNEITVLPLQQQQLK